MKYVIVERENTKKGTTRIFQVALFSDNLVHADMVPKGHIAVGAGTCSIISHHAQVLVTVSGKSETLGLVSAFEDALFIQQWLQFGDSMAVMATEAHIDASPARKHR